MRNLLVEISYQGQAYHGYQVQHNAVSVAQVLQDAIQAVLGKREDIIGCSRTDTGVHANSFYFNMHTANPIPENRLVDAMNDRLPADIAVLSCMEVPTKFHARYDCVQKEYVYRIWNAPIKNPFLKGMVLHYRPPLQVNLLNDCAKAFIGTHDFKAFCAAGSKPMRNTIRTVHNCYVFSSDDHDIYFQVSGTGFLYNMVRIMIGTLLEIAEQRIQSDQIPHIIQSGNRTLAGRTVSAEGLYLNRVEYGREWFVQA